MGKNPRSIFYWKDWRNDANLRLCSYAARGLWMDMLALMAESDRPGYLQAASRPLNSDDIARLTGGTPQEVSTLISELERHGVFSRGKADVIINRRMAREASERRQGVTNGGKGGNPKIRRGTVPKEKRVRPFRRADAPAKTRRIFEREGGRCHWCGVELIFDVNLRRNQRIPPNLFHVDHVIAVCDGGTNDEENLVAACARCNHDRARIPTHGASESGRNDVGVSVGFRAEDMSELVSVAEKTTCEISPESKEHQHIRGPTREQGVNVGNNPTASPTIPPSPLTTSSSTDPPSTTAAKPQARNGSGKAEAVAAVIRAFDDARAEAFGEAQRRPWPHADDGVWAERWLAAGAPPDRLQAVFAEIMARKHAADPDDPPGSLRYCDAAVARALRSRDRGPDPPVSLEDDFTEEERRKAREILWREQGIWKDEWGPRPE